MGRCINHNCAVVHDLIHMDNLFCAALLCAALEIDRGRGRGFHRLRLGRSSHGRGHTGSTAGASRVGRVIEAGS